MRYFFANYVPSKMAKLGMSGTLFSICLICTVAANSRPCAFAQTGDSQLNKDQREKALEKWQRGMREEEKPTFVESKNFLICAKLPEKTLKAVGVNLEKNFKLASKVLDIKKLDMWRGKLTVYLMPDKRTYKFFIIRTEVRRPAAVERGSISVRTDYPHVVACPPKHSADLPVTEQAGAQVAIALLQKKFKKDVPGWIQEGFGRATVMKSGSFQRRARELAQVRALIQGKKAKARDAWSYSIPDEEAALVRGSLVELLAYSGLTKRFEPMLKKFRPTGNNTNVPSTNAVFKSLNVNLDRLDAVWAAWAQKNK